jgi:hypothetical protein
MWKTFWIGGIVLAVLVAAGVWAAASATFLYRHPKAPDLRIVIDKRTGAPVVEALADPKKPALLGSTEPEPRVRVSSTQHDFGIMDPDSTGRYGFEIYNIGAGPLKLKLGPTSCKCTLSGLSKDQVLPGEKAEVNLEWNTGHKVLSFEQSAVVLTNDPLNKEVELRVSGKVRMAIALDRPEIILPAGAPDAGVKFDVLIYSQLWDDFAVENLQSLVKDLKWEVTTVEPVRFPKLDARSVKLLTVEFPQPVLQGGFTEQMRLSIRPLGSTLVAQDDAVRHIDLPVSGSVLRRLAIYGPAITSDGIVNLGTMRHGAGKQVKLIVKVRDSQTDLGTPKLEIFPETLAARLTPHSGDKGSGLYDLSIEVPPGTGPCQYLTSPLGRLAIVTDHPRIGTMEVKLSFAVLPR